MLIPSVVSPERIKEIRELLEGAPMGWLPEVGRVRSVTFSAAQYESLYVLISQGEKLTKERDELQAWKASEQSALLQMATELLLAGFKGDGVVEGVKWLTATLARVRADLRKYGVHDTDCQIDGNGDIERPCSCGFDAARVSPVSSEQGHEDL